MFSYSAHLLPGGAYEGNEWNSDKYISLEKRKAIGEVKNIATQIGISEALKELKPGARVIDWGHGKGSNFPLVYLPDFELIPIEPIGEAVGLSYKEGRINNVAFHNLITKPIPPYPLSDHSIDGILGITSFHTLPYAEMVMVGREFRRIIRDIGPVCHIQDVSAARNFLDNIPDPVLTKMIEYLTYKYNGLSFKRPEDPRRDDFWTQYLSIGVKRINSYGYWLIDDTGLEKPKHIEENPEIPLVIPGKNMLNVYLEKLSSFHNIPMKVLIERINSSNDLLRSDLGVLFHRMAFILAYAKFIPTNELPDKFLSFFRAFTLGNALLINDIIDTHVPSLLLSDMVLN